ncbi:hypothetical protein Tco_0784250 [Tanacetum coccineum]
MEQICYNVQFKPHVLASRAKKAAKNHDPLALIAHSNASSSYSHSNFSYSPQPYYVTHPPSVFDYDDEYQGELQGDSQEDKMVELAYKPIMQVMVEMLTRMLGETELKGLIHEMQVMKAIRLFSVFHKPSLLQEKKMFTMKDEAESNLSNEENDFMLDTSYGEDLEELTASVKLMARLQLADENAETVPSYDAKAVSQLEKKAFKEREDWYLDDILDLEEKLSSHDRIVYKMGQSIQTIHMLGKKPNKVYDPFLKARLGYINPVRLKKAIAAQLKCMMTLSEIKEELIEEVQEMLNVFVSMEQKVNDKSPIENILDNEIDRLLEASLTSEIRNCMFLLVEQKKHELLKVELEKSASDSRDIQANLLKRIKILENDFQRSQA